MVQRKVLVLGDSHTRAIRRAVEARAAREEAAHFEVHWLRVEKEGQVHGELPMEEALARASGLGADGLVVILLAGTLHNLFGMLKHAQPYDVFVPRDETMALAQGTAAIPESMLWDMLLMLARRNRRIERIRRAASCAVCHVATPPPKQDQQFILECTARYLEKLPGNAEIAPAEQRLRLWNLEMRVVRHLCDEWGMAFVPAPAAARCPLGFLKREYYGKDVTHANPAYGELVLRQLEQLRAGRGQPARTP